MSNTIETSWGKTAKRWNTFLQENDQHMVDFLYIYVGFPEGEFLGERSVIFLAANVHCVDHV